MALVSVVIALALIEYLVFGLLVGRARVRCQVPAPAITGHEVFERYFRVQQNTLEQLIVFVPAMWIFGSYVSPLWGAVLGMVFIAGRWFYFTGYVRDPRQRGLGFGMSFLPNAMLVLGGLAGAVVALYR